MKRTSGDPCFSGSKKRRRLSFSEDDTIGSKSSDSPPMSKIYNSACGSNKPAELFRKDLISAMKLPDSEQLDDDDFWNITDSWKQEWERGVQVPVNSKILPLPLVRKIRKVQHLHFKMPKKFIHITEDEQYASDIHVLSQMTETNEKCRYDLDDVDRQWLEIFNEHRLSWGFQPLSEETFELVIEDFEEQCFNKFQSALKTEEGLGIEYDDDVICDVCRSPDCEEGNEMVFCDICNICVHQACYGITAIPEGSWVCRTCAANVHPSCVLCPNKGGAMKSTKKGDVWAHVSCALWVPEVVIGDPNKMEPISKISQVPSSRWSLICTFCRERVGACIQCAVKQCKVAYHVTCAFESGIEINVIYNEDSEEYGVRLKSFCLKHSHQNIESSEDEGNVWRMKTQKKEKLSKVSHLEKHNARLHKIREMESVFFKYVDCKRTKVPDTDLELVNFIFNYWKLKRSANFNKPVLLPMKLDEASLLGKQPDDDKLIAKMKMFVHIRQDLERVRNLCYMVGRREKLRRTYIRSQKEVFLKQCEILDEGQGKHGVKDIDSVIAGTFGESIYDCIYFGAKFKPSEISKSDSESQGEKKKLTTSARLPNPYAKLYFNGIHTRSRRHSSTAGSSTVCKNSNEKSVAENKDLDDAASPESSNAAVVIKIEPEDDDDNAVSEPVLEQSAFVKTEKKSALSEEKPTKKVSRELRSSDRIAVGDMANVKEEGKKNSPITDDESLNDLKNSPSQSDKENVVANPKPRGRRSKSQSDACSPDLKIVKEELLTKFDGTTKRDRFKSVSINEALKSSNTRSSRYEMRSRNSNANSLQETSVVTSLERPIPTKNTTLEKEEEEEEISKSEKSTKLVMSVGIEENIVEKEKEPTSPNNEEAIIHRKGRLKRKKKTRRKLLKKKASKEEICKPVQCGRKSESSDSCVSEDSPSEEEEPQIEYKMTVRKNGKMLLSSLTKRTPSQSPMSPKEEVQEQKHLRHSSVSSSACELSCDSADSQLTSPTNRDLTSSPRLVLKLVKDRKKKLWKKKSVDLDQPPSLREDCQSCEVMDNVSLGLLPEEFEALRLLQEEEDNRPRYMMRSRTKTAS